MADQEPKTLEQMPQSPEQVLQSLDQMLATEDPNFASEMSDVQAAGAESTDVVIEASAIDASEDELKDDGKKENFLKRALYRARRRIILFFSNLIYEIKSSAIWLFKQLKIWIPAAIKAALGFIKGRVKAFGQLNNTQKLAFVFGTLMLVGFVALIKINMKGQWIPAVDHPELKRFSEIADKEIDVGPEKQFVPLYAAFSLPNYEFLLPKFKSNLKPTAEHSLPMAAMELIITLDSRETAVEMKDREAAVFDRVQRVIEGVSYEQLNTILGKEHLKALIKKDLNTLLTQGWVEDVSYKTLVLKP